MNKKTVLFGILFLAIGQQLIFAQPKNDALKDTFEVEIKDSSYVIPKIPMGDLTIQDPKEGMLYFDTVTKELKIFRNRRWESLEAG